MVTIKSKFIGYFVIGDNVVFNLKTLSLLHQMQVENPSQAKLLRKPIIIASVAEAVLHDLFLRINHHTVEGVPNIDDDTLDDLRTKVVDKFANYISISKSKELLGGEDSIYDELDELRKLRNRVHIQNPKEHFEEKEYNAFTKERQVKAEKTLEKLLRIMESNYNRPLAHQYVDDFILPWNSYFDSLSEQK